MTETTPSTPTSPAPISTIANIGQHVGQTVTLQGWLYNLRSSGKLLFPTFRDGTGTIQGIVPKAAVPEVVFTTLKALGLESSLTVTGQVRADPRAPSGFELDVQDIHVISPVDPAHPFPISLKEHGVDFLMEHRHLWIRTPRQSAILRVRATIMRACAEYFDTHGFTRTDPPILTPNACEGTSELFEMDYFDNDKAYLTQSGQLYIEATALALGKVYSFGPTFRAEKSKTRRHLTEFWMVEPEMAYADLEDLMDLAERYLTHIVATVLQHHRADLKVIGRDISKLELVITPDAATTPGAPSSPAASSPERVGSEAPQTSSKITSPEGLVPTPAPIVSPTEGEAAVEEPASAPAQASGTHAEGKTPRTAFPRLSYDQAHAMLEQAFARGKIEAPHKYGDDFGSPDETYLSSQFDKPVIVHRYPAAIKAFYMQPDPGDPTKALCVDVLAPEGYGEIIGGSQRIDSFDLLKHRIEEAHLPLAAFEWYLDLRRYGSVPHCGFGMGIERVVAWICGLDHVRETIPFARTLNRIYP
jgi:asparaginyl-tRNA synthetase